MPNTHRARNPTISLTGMPMFFGPAYTITNVPTAATAEPEVIKKGKGDEEKADAKDAGKDKK